jgi:formylglycine-generating enzyme required for sulfatase activity
LPRLVRELVEVEPELGRRLARAIPLSRLKADGDLLAMCEALQKIGFITARRQVGGASMVRLASLQLLESWPRLADAYESAREMPLLEASGEVPIPSGVLDMPLSELAEDVDVTEEAGEITVRPDSVPAQGRFSRLLQNWPPLGAAAATAVVVFLIGAWILQWGPFGKTVSEPIALARSEGEPPEASANAANTPGGTSAESTAAGPDGENGTPVAGTEVAMAPASTNLASASPAVQPTEDETVTPVIPADAGPTAPKPEESPRPAVTATESAPAESATEAPIPAEMEPETAVVSKPIPAGAVPPDKSMPAEASTRPEKPGDPDVVASVTTPQIPLKTSSKPSETNPPKPEAPVDSAASDSTVPLGPFVDDAEIVNSLKMKLRRIPAGTFRMGSPMAEASRNSDELARDVTLTRSFHMGIHEVTQAEYEQVMGKNPSGFKGRTLPVDTVSWVQAVQFCERLSARPEERAAGRRYRLPTEAEWEYACRGGVTTVFSFGDKATSRDANFDGTQPYGGLAGPDLAGTIVVGSYKPNEFGLFDMHGNVSEWCQDWFARSVDGAALVDPQGPSEGQRRVIRGGSWLSSGAECRSAWRGSEAPNGFDSILGFRVVCVPAE